MGRHWFGVVELEELLMAHSKSFVLLFPILLACVRLVSTYFVESFAVPIHFQQGRSRENDECERIYDEEEALNIIFVFMRTGRNVERVLHSVVFYWTIFTDVLFFKWGCQLRLTDNAAASTILWSHVWIDIWLSTACSSWSKLICTVGYLLLINMITCTVNRFKGEMASFHIKMKSCCGKTERYRSSGSKSSSATALLSRLIFAGCLFANFLHSSLAYNSGTSWRNENAFAALKEDGTVQAWGSSGSGGSGVPLDLKDVRAIYSTFGAFAALKEDGTVQAWGSSGSGGSGVPADLKDVRAIYSTGSAFAALKEDGTVQAWGSSGSGGSGLPANLTDVRAIYSTYSAFAALKEDGTVQAWGDSRYGGSVVPADLKDVRAIYSATYAFAAVKEDGTVQAWGSSSRGGSGVPADLKDVRAIYSTFGAFAALKEDGTVQAWGDSRFGGSGVPADLKDVRAIYSTFGAFAALKEDGTVQAWGSSGSGGSGVPADLKDVRAIYSTGSAFAALKEDGTVQAWGSSGSGGSGLPANLTDVRAIYSTGSAFAALKEDGTVQAWGSSGSGGSGLPANLTDVRAIYSTGSAFAALKEDGTVQAWGTSRFGGSMTNGRDSNGYAYTGVPTDLQGVKTIFGSTEYYADSTSAHHYPCPNNTYGPGFPNCTTCPLGTNQPRGRPGIRSSIGSCIECKPGRYSTDGTSCSKSCLPRSLNVSSYNWFDGKELCLSCVLGKHLNVNISRSECTTCPAGRYRGSEGQVTCTECPTGQYAVEGSIRCSACEDGKTTLPGRGFAKTDCFKVCPKGEYGTSNKCIPCEAGKYSNTKSGTGACTSCEAGKAQPLTSQTSCATCERGKWVNVQGATECSSCPPGSLCPKEGMSDPEECPVGRYADTKERQSCAACPAGQFQNSTGSAKCLLCPSGKYLPRRVDGKGADSSTLCILCPRGTYGDKGGLAECSRCPTGQVQPNEGQTSCSDCSLVSKIKTNNAEHTACIDNKALLSTSVVEVMFNKGVALGLAFIIAAIFLGLAVAMHHLKEMYSSEVSDEALADLKFLQVALKSALPGFSFGSEMVFIWGMMTEGQRGFGGAMLAFRMLHPLTIILLTCILFITKDANLPERLRKMVRMSRLNEKFVRKNIAPVGILVLASGCDVTMIQLMPWEQSRFYEESMGYPCFDLMTVCMVVKTLQSLVSVICQAAYLIMNSDLSDPTMSIQAKILFSLSITLSMVQLIMGVMMLSLKSALLKKIADEEEEEEEDKREKNQADNNSREDAGIEIGDVYRNNDEELAINSIPNPMHTSAFEMIKKKNEEIDAKNEEIATLNARVNKLETENDDLRQQHTGIDAHHDQGHQDKNKAEKCDNL